MQVGHRSRRSRFDEIFERYIEPCAVWFGGLYAIVTGFLIVMAHL